MDKKRLLKDLPFANLKVGAVLTHGNGGYYVNCGETFYSSGGSSSNGYSELEKKEADIVDVIWDNEEWFEEATFHHIDIKVSTTKIEIIFDSLDLDQAQTFAKGIQHCLMKFGEDENYTWNEFKGFTMSIK